MSTVPEKHASKILPEVAPQPPLLLSASDISDSVTSFHGMTGRSPSMRRLFSQIHRYAPHLVIATIEGEDGTGKSMAARVIHTASAMKGPLVSCLASSFFFANTSSGESYWAYEILEQARDGLLYLDRVHALTSAQQASLTAFLLRFEDQRPTSLRTQPGPWPRQLIFSSSIALRRLASAYRLRTDIASRLCAMRFLLPPLRERREDIPLLAQIFLQQFSRTHGKPVRGLGPGTIAPLLRYSWPGNVRELESVITSAAMQTESQWIRPIDLPFLGPADTGPADQPGSPRATALAAANPTDPAASQMNLDHVIREHVNRTLQHTRGNKLQAAQLMGISRSTLYRILAAKRPLGS